MMKGKKWIKRHIWAVLWGTGCILITGVLWQRCFGWPAGCTLQDLKTAPAQRWMNTGAQVSADEPTRRQVFLTFDDGPSATTETVLDILKEECVPATFFVIAAENNREHLPLLRRTAAEGHQIALHSCTHEYRDIYSSASAYWEDIKELRQQLAPYVEVENIHWLRFPGGSTNTVSHRYGGSGIMKQLKRQAGERGYHYVDWNVCAGDAAGGRPSAGEILQNIILDAEGKDTCVVLMHDTKATKTTAEALPDVIDWFRSEGYTFCTIDQLERDEPGSGGGA